MSKKSEFQTVGDGAHDVPAVKPASFGCFRRIRNIFQRVVQGADPYILVLRQPEQTPSGSAVSACQKITSLRGGRSPTRQSRNFFAQVSRVFTSIDGIPTPVCALAWNDVWFFERPVIGSACAPPRNDILKSEILRQSVPGHFGRGLCCLWDKMYQNGTMHNGGMNVRIWRTRGREELGKDIQRDLKCILYRLFNGPLYR